MQVFIDDERGIAADDVGGQGFMTGAAAVYDHPRVGCGAIQNAIFDEVSGLVQHAGIGGFARIDLGHVAGGRVVQHRGGMRPDDVQLLQTRDVHQSGFGADRDVILRHVLRVSPCRAHAVPIFQLRAEGAMPLRQNRVAPTECHVFLQRSCKGGLVPGNYSGAVPGVVGLPSS